MCLADFVRPTDRAISGAGAVVEKGTASSGKDRPAIVGKLIEEASEETRKPQVARRPYTPTAAEVEAHLPLHLEYRSWCPHCVAGKGISTQHRQRIGDKEELGITLSLDYCFMTADDVESDMRAILVCNDHSKKG